MNLPGCIRNSGWPCLFSVFLDSCGSAASAAILKSMQPTVSTHFMSKVPQHSMQIIHASGKVVPEVADASAASDGLRRRNAGNQQMGSLEAPQGASEACQDNSAEVRAALGGWAPMLRTRVEYGMILITVLNLYSSFGKDGFNDDVRWIRFDWCFEILVGY